MTKEINIKPINLEYHVSDNFREQLFVLYPDGFWIDRNGCEYIKFIKTLVAVCKQGLASFDKKNPGIDSLNSWEVLDNYIEKEGVRGFYHTHPPGINEFSGLDEKFQITVAQANGVKYIWHVVQACDSDKARVVCFNMVNGNLVMKYDFGFIQMNPKESILLLPLPCRIESGNSYHTIVM